MVYGTKLTIVTGDYKPTYNFGAGFYTPFFHVMMGSSDHFKTQKFWGYVTFGANTITPCMELYGIITL